MSDSATKFGARLATVLGGPQGAGQYAANPQPINQAIRAVEQQLALSESPLTSMKGQFVKEWLWPSLLDPPLNPPKMKPQAAANPMSAPGGKSD